MPLRRITPVVELLAKPAPCDACRHSIRCGQTGEACVAFRSYAKGEAEHRWRLQPTQPRADIGGRLGFIDRQRLVSMR